MAFRSSAREAMPCRPPGLILILLALLVSPAAAMPDSSSREVLLAVMNLDRDCHPDSLYGRTWDSEHFLPTRVVWGAYDTLHHPPCPHHPMLPLHLPTYPETTFEYPLWENLKGTVSVQRVNASDSVADLVFAIWGRTTGSTPKDTLRRICMFGGPGMDTVPVIDLATLPMSQIGPFAALDLAIGTHLIEPEERDMTGRPSYILLPVDAPGPPPLPRTEQAAGVAWDVRVYPNPVVGTTAIEGRPLPPGEYRVEVIAVDGSIAARREVTVGADGDFFGTLDLTDLASSFYVLRIYSADRIVGDVPILKRK